MNSSENNKHAGQDKRPLSFTGRLLMVLGTSLIVAPTFVMVFRIGEITSENVYPWILLVSLGLVLVFASIRFRREKNGVGK